MRERQRVMTINKNIYLKVDELATKHDLKKQKIANDCMEIGLKVLEKKLCNIT